METHDRILEFRPPRIAMSLIFLATLTHVILPLDLHASLPLAGGVIGCIGLGIMLRAWCLFRAHDNAICPTAPTAILLTHDVFALSRNPMYLGIALILLGIAVAAGTLPYYLATVANFAIIDRHFCPYEEQKLRRLFAARYDEYERRVGRWL